MSTCSIDGCDRPHRARSWCNNHYHVWLRNGDPLHVVTEEERFLSKVNKTDSCWIWTANSLPSGYGMFRAKAGRRLAHRASYEMYVGEIPEGYQIDHTCHMPSCVNPEHLRVVTPKQNCENLSGAPVRSKTGIRGVTWSKHAKRWLVHVGHNGKQFHVGYFSTIAEAEAAAIAKRNELFTHNDKDRIAS